jgi:hypothetical protein
MGFLFGGGGGGDGGAAQKQVEMQEKQIAKEEKQLAAQETQAAETRQATMKARRRGGLRPLLSMAREDSEIGITDKLGGSSSYMG